MAARNATTGEALRLIEAFEQMEANADDEAEAIRADILFHQRLFEACHNQLLYSLVRTVIVVLKANFELSIKDGKGFIRNLEEHGEVADAVRRGDPEAARAAMLRILTTNAEGIELMRLNLAEAGRPEKPRAGGDRR
jgi:DNA-binding FadR family transcriptional regulator